MNVHAHHLNACWKISCGVDITYIVRGSLEWAHRIRSEQCNRSRCPADLPRNLLSTTVTNSFALAWTFLEKKRASRHRSCRLIWLIKRVQLQEHLLHTSSQTLGVVSISSRIHTFRRIRPQHITYTPVLHRVYHPGVVLILWYCLILSKEGSKVERFCSTKRKVRGRSEKQKGKSADSKAAKIRKSGWKRKEPQPTRKQWTRRKPTTDPLSILNSNA